MSYTSVFQFLKSSKAPKAARRKLAIWPWEFQDKFEGECIEETCKPDEIAEFCSRKKANIDDPDKNKRLNTRREERYSFCRQHVDKLVDNIKTTAKKKEGELEPWQHELTPERLFRGWWEELKKAYLRSVKNTVKVSKRNGRTDRLRTWRTEA